MKQQKHRKNSYAGSKKRRKSSLAGLWPIIAIGVVLIAVGCLFDRNGAGDLSAGSAERHSTLRISEVQTGNGSTLRTAAGEAADWIEIENTGSESVSLNGLSIVVNERVNRAFVFPNVSLDGGECLLVYADGLTSSAVGDELHAPFRLPASGGSTLRLVDGSTVLDMVEIPEMDLDYSYCRGQDGAWTVSAEVTPGRSNHAYVKREITVSEGMDVIELSEVMTSNNVYFPDENGEYSDYIELHNTSGESVSLKGYCLTDDLSRLNKWELPEVSIPAGGYLAVHCSGYDRKADESHLHTRFKLSREGETICLSNPNGDAVSMVQLPLLECGQAYSLVNGEWTSAIMPTPNAENSEEAGVKLNERMLAQSSVTVRISEIMAAPENEAHDWVELYNAGQADVDLSGWGLSDELDQPRKWQFPAGTVIGANQYLAVFLTGGAQAQVSGYLSAGFALPAAGGITMSLSSPDGTVLDYVYLPQQSSGVSYGRTDGGQCGYLAAATPLSANGSGYYAGRAQQAKYSVSGGLFKTGDSFSVSLSAEKGARIYYTLDCSDPTEASLYYDGTPISVSSTTILRTRVYKDGFLPSLMKTQSYLYDVNAADQVPYVVSLVSDPEGLYSDRTGIMVKGPNAWPDFPYGAYGEGANYWMDWERESHIEFFTASGETPISQECGIKIHGRNSRAYELKPLKVISRGTYGDPTFAYPIFSDRPYEEYERFILRYAGQDYKYTFMRDAVLTSLAENTSVMYQEAEECICYLNGKYYSAMYVREHMSPYSIVRYNGWDPADEAAIDLVKGSYTVMQGSNDTYEALKEWLKKHDASTQEAYEKIDSIVDIDNFIEFISMQIVIGTPDTVNVKRYRNPNEDGKWRWILYDVDRGLRENVDGFELLAQGTNAHLFQACMKNPIIRERFLEYLNSALAGYLSSANIAEKTMEQLERIKPVLPDYLNMIGESSGSYKGYLKTFLRGIGRRPEQVIEHCANYLNLSDAEVQRYFPDAIAAIKAYEAPSIS